MWTISNKYVNNHDTNCDLKNPYLCEADQQGSWQSANDGEAEFGSMLILERSSRDLRITNPAIITLLPGDSSTTLKILNTILE